MAASCLDGLIYATACTTETNHIFHNARLRHEVLECDVDVARKLFVEQIAALLRTQLIDRSATAFPEATKIQSKDVDARAAKTIGEIVPDFALAIALVKQQNAWTRFCRAEIGGFEFCAVRGGEVYDLGSGW